MSSLNNWMTEKYAYCVEEDIWQVIAYGVYYLLPMRTRVYGLGKIDDIDLDIYLREELIYLGLFGMSDMNDYLQTEFPTIHELDLPREIVKNLDDQKYYLGGFFRRQFSRGRWVNFVRDYCGKHDLNYGEIIGDEEGKTLDITRENVRHEMAEHPNLFLKETKKLFDEHAAKGTMITLEEYLDFTLKYIRDNSM